MPSIGKSGKCPVWEPGATLVSIQDVFVLWKSGDKVGALKLWRDNNTTLVKPAKLRAYRQHLKLTNPAELKMLDDFIRTFCNWFGAENIISGAKPRKSLRKSSRSIVIDGKSVTLLSHAPWNHRSDDQRNGTYYKDRQLTYIGKG